VTVSQRIFRVASPPASRFADEAARLSELGPEWLREKRAAAWVRARELGLPSAEDETWRWSDLQALDAEQYRAPLPVPWSGELSDEARRSGVILCDLQRAAADHEGLVREHLGALAPADDGLLARNLALHHGGSFLYVPRGVELHAPVGLDSHVQAGAATHMRNLIVVEPGARLVVDERSVSDSLAAPALLHEVTELFLGEGSWVGWLQWQGLARSGARQASFRRARLGRDAHLESLAVNLGAEYSRSWLEVSLDGTGARSDLLGIAYPTGTQRVESWTVQEHVAPHATSDLLYRAVLDDRARSLYYGTIRVKPGASRTDAYQANRNLLLSSGARADTNPQLEIANNDVRCTHGATVGPIDEEQLFYLMSRGLPRRVAERLLVLGFFGDVLARGAWSEAGPALEEALRERAHGETVR
jgi:Fe-S cluster assembly protein SufD